MKNKYFIYVETCETVLLNLEIKQADFKQKIEDLKVKEIETKENDTQLELLKIETKEKEKYIIKEYIYLIACTHIVLTHYQAKKGYQFTK